MPTKTITAITTEAPANDYQMRPVVTEVIAYWSTTVPMLHNAEAKCMKRWEDLEIKTADWAAGQLMEEQSAEEQGHGGAAAHQFCTRCLVELTARARGEIAEAKAALAVTVVQVGETEVVIEAERINGERLEKEAIELAGKVAFESKTPQELEDADEAYFEDDTNFDGSKLAALQATYPAPVDPWTVKDAEGVSEDDVAAEMAAKAKPVRKPRAPRKAVSRGTKLA